MTEILGYARVSTGDQDVAGQTMRLADGGAIRVFTDVMSGKSMDRPAVVIAINGGVELAVRAEGGKLEHVVALARPTRSAEQPRGNFEVGLARQCIPPAFARG